LALFLFIWQGFLAEIDYIKEDMMEYVVIVLAVLALAVFDHLIPWWANKLIDKNFPPEYKQPERKDEVK